MVDSKCPTWEYFHLLKFMRNPIQVKRLICIINQIFKKFWQLFLTSDIKPHLYATINTNTFGIPFLGKKKPLMTSGYNLRWDTRIKGKTEATKGKKSWMWPRVVTCTGCLVNINQISRVSFISNKQDKFWGSEITNYIKIFYILTKTKSLSFTIHILMHWIKLLSNKVSNMLYIATDFHINRTYKHQMF